MHGRRTLFGYMKVDYLRIWSAYVEILAEILAESWVLVSHSVKHVHFSVVTMQLYIWDKAKKRLGIVEVL